MASFRLTASAPPKPGHHPDEPPGQPDPLPGEPEQPPPPDPV